jgi:hypothetical protein
VSCTVHIRQADGSFAEWTVESMADARRAIEARAAELGSAFSRGQIWENHPLGLRIGFEPDEGWSDGHPRTCLASAPSTTPAVGS